MHSKPVYNDLGSLLNDLWEVAIELEMELMLNYRREVFLDLVYIYALIDYWEEVYLIYHGRLFTIFFF